MSIPSCAVLLSPLFVVTLGEPDERIEAVVDSYLSEAREVLPREDDFLLHVLYECGFDNMKALKSLKRVFLPQDH